MDSYQHEIIDYRTDGEMVMSLSSRNQALAEKKTHC